MTNAELIQKIRAEIERLKGQLIRGACAAQIEMETNCKDEAYDELLSFLDTLEGNSEKPNNHEGLDEAAYKYSFESRPSVYGQVDVIDAFKAGAEWQAEHTPLPEDTVLFNKGVEEGRRLAEEEQADLFTIVALDAAQRAKEQMMKGAVEGEVVKDISNKLAVTAKINLDGFKFGDKVRIIIVNEDE